MNSRSQIFFLGSLSLFFCTTAFGEDPFAENIRKTEALTPEQEQKALHVPPGFEVQLVASGLPNRANIPSLRRSISQVAIRS